MVNAATGGGWTSPSSRVSRADREPGAGVQLPGRDLTQGRHAALRVQHEPIPEGPSKGMCCPPDELDRMLDEYYDLRGWTRDGIPTPERLAALDLATGIPA